MHTAVAVCNVVLNRRICSKQLVVCSVLLTMCVLYPFHPRGMWSALCTTWLDNCNMHVVGMATAMYNYNECACEQCALVG